MNYDDWKSTEPNYMQDEWDRQFDAWDDPMTLDNEDYSYMDAQYNPSEFESLEYKERVVNDLLNAMDEFLKFSTFRELMKIIVGNV